MSYRLCVADCCLVLMLQCNIPSCLLLSAFLSHWYEALNRGRHENAILNHFTNIVETMRLYSAQLSAKKQCFIVFSSIRFFIKNALLFSKYPYQKSNQQSIRNLSWRILLGEEQVLWTKVFKTPMKHNLTKYCIYTAYLQCITVQAEHTFRWKKRLNTQKTEKLYIFNLRTLSLRSKQGNVPRYYVCNISRRACFSLSMYDWAWDTSTRDEQIQALCKLCNFNRL